MEVGNKNKILFSTLLVLLFLGGFFCWEKSLAESGLSISRVEVGKNEKDEFIEIYNSTEKDINLKELPLKLHIISSSGKDVSKTLNFLDEAIGAHKYFLIATSAYTGDEKISARYSSSGNTLVKNGVVYISTSSKENEDVLDYVYCIEGYPHKELEDEESDTAEYSSKISITELLPNPADGGDEYIELYNNSDEKIELKNWSLHDASEFGEYIFSAEDEIESEEYLAVYGETFKFALNNGGDEKITLYDPNKKRVFEVAYKSSKKGVSYNFDGEKWRWSSFLTPGTENIFEEIPDGKIKIDKKVFVEVFANFEVIGLSKKAKVIWDFGDGHKSYLQKTKHKYKKIGKYEASVKYSEGSEDVTEKFTIEVEKIKHPEVKIVAVNANPVGSDTKNETITVQNKSKKKINLMGWSIATGWKKLVNHPITEKIEIKAGKKKEITRESSKFTLNNKKAEIELKYPDGKTAYKMKYKKEDKGVAEGEMYVKEKGGWNWVASIQQATDSKQQKTNNIQPKASGNQIEGNNQEGAEENKEPEVIEEDVEIVIKKKEMPVLLAVQNKYFAKTKISSGEPQVLGAEIVREVDGAYVFTPEGQPVEHYAINFLKNIFAIINTRINFVINFFSN